LIVFGGALLGMFLRSVLPEPHVGSDSKDTVRVGIGLVLTITAMVLSLLIASAKTYFDSQSSELTDMASKVMLLDRVLSHYGPESKEARAKLRTSVSLALNTMWLKNRSPTELSLVGGDAMYDTIQDLSPGNDAQRSLKAQALSIALALGQTRLLMYEQSAAGVAWPLLALMVFWLTVAFISFGLFSPRNLTVAAGLFLCALAASGAVFLILELYSPFTGLVHISDTPLRAALAHLGQ
jgi:Protein of unknown function (DUF4239)